MKYVLLFITICAILVSNNVSFAVTDTFTISQSVVAADTGAPTIPLNVLATAVDSDAIDITWDASTDDIAVTGYQIFRDNVQIATTALLAYTDTGLTDSTTYDYNITAFDAVGNISARSATTSDTTFALATSSPTVTGAGGGGAVVPIIPQITNFRITVDKHSATLYWETSIPTRATVSWGISSSFEMGALVERTLLRRHSTHIVDLKPHTRYEFRIIATDRSGNETVLRQDIFVTDRDLDLEAPPNVSLLRGAPDGNDAVLMWKNPLSEDFSHVRIIRSSISYPKDPFDGELIYEGLDTSFRDNGAFSASERHYYTLFSYDKIGNSSSGAIVRVARQNPNSESPTPIQEFETAPLYKPFSFSAIHFYQNGKEVSFIGKELAIDNLSPFEINIPYEELPEHLKTIIVTLHDSVDSTKEFSFLLRINKQKTAYTGLISAIRDIGSYPISVFVLDYKNRSLSKAEGTLHVVPSLNMIPMTAVPETTFTDYILSILSRWTFAFFLLLMLLLIYTKLSKQEKKTIATI